MKARQTIKPNSHQCQSVKLHGLRGFEGYVVIWVPGYVGGVGQNVMRVEKVTLVYKILACVNNFLARV